MRKFNRIVGIFGRVSDKLEKLEQKNLKKADAKLNKVLKIEAKIEAKLARLHEIRDNLKQEAAAALATAKKLQALISNDD